LPVDRREKFSLIKNFFLAGFGAGILLLIYANFVSALIASITVFNLLGSILAVTALAAGSLFLIYSIKYYVSIISLLMFSRRSGKDPAGLKNHLQAGMMSDLSAVTLNHLPFISIHLPVYNERRVVNRLLEAATSLTYENYEVIVCDDSTDETTQIVNEWRNHPKVKISHRESREGFKGGALAQAVKLMDARTEFVLVFDADFLPYPDTITQFLKYYQVATEGESSGPSPVAAIQGYQWHVLNKSENWITRGVRTEYAGSYVIERSGSEVYGGLKQIAGSVFMVRADILRDPKYAWGRSITEDFELTLKLYRDGYKVIYTPYVQAPSECVSTLKRLIRQRMRWAEGHSFNIKKYFSSLMKSKYMSRAEKFEFIYFSPYYLQSFLFLTGTFAWFLSEAVFKVQLPYWTAVWGWSLVLTNLLSLPLMNTVGLFLEESESKDFAGIASFILLTYILAPFQAFAAVKGLFEKAEGPWFRTPKTGRITDTFTRGNFYRWISKLFKPNSKLSVNLSIPRIQLKLALVEKGQGSKRNGGRHFISRTILILLIILTTSLTSLPRAVPTIQATNPSDPKWYVRDVNTGQNSNGAISCPTATNCKLLYGDTTTGNLYFYDCDDATCTTGTRTSVSTTLSDGISMYCSASDDCKVVYQDTSADVRFVDCGNETCSSKTDKLVDGNAGCLLTGCNTTGNVGTDTSIYCPTSSNCKVVYRDSTNSSLAFADCDAADCSSGTVTQVDGATCGLTGCSASTNSGITPSIYCLTSTDCKIAYQDLGNTAAMFADCDDETCSTGTVSLLDGVASCVLTNCSTTTNSGYYDSIYCPATDDCKIAYYDLTNSSLRVADCATNSCSSGSTTLADGATGFNLTGGGTNDVGATPAIYCLTATDCKISYYDVTNGALWFADCDQSSVMCDSGTTKKMDGIASCLLTNCSTTTDTGEYNNMYCLSASDCKMLYYNVTSNDVVFADCDDTTCSTGTKITVDGNKIINATTGGTTTTRTFGATGDSFVYVSDVQYPTGSAAGSLGSGTYTLNLRFDTNTVSGTLTWNYEVGYCTVASDCTTQTAHITSTNQSLTSGTTSPQTPTTSTASSLTIPAPVSANWIYVKIAVVTAPASGTIRIRMDNTSGNTADTYISIPALSVPEFVFYLMPVAILGPVLVTWLSRRRRLRNLTIPYR
jgi:cellulose synthase/poly-beta-1,6-N-acetylglucosamine synthase-like glycosyltransferase